MSEAVGSVAEEAAKLFAALGHTSGPECQICPICQFLAVLRTASPDVFEHLAEAAASLLLAVRAIVDSPRRRAGVPVERIDIG